MSLTRYCHENVVADPINKHFYVKLFCITHILSLQQWNTVERLWVGILKGSYINFDWLIDWLIEWLIWLIWLIDLIDWLKDWLIDWLIENGSISLLVLKSNVHQCRKKSLTSLFSRLKRLFLFSHSSLVLVSFVNIFELLCFISFAWLEMKWSCWWWWWWWYLSLDLCFFWISSKYQQFKLAKYCEEIFEDLLLQRPLDPVPVSSRKVDMIGY